MLKLQVHASSVYDYCIGLQDLGPGVAPASVYRAMGRSRCPPFNGQQPLTTRFTPAALVLTNFMVIIVLSLHL